MSNVASIRLSGPAPDATGAAMDQPVNPARGRAKCFGFIAAGTVAILGVVGSFLWLIPEPGARFVPRDRVTITAVARGAFEDYAPLRLEVTPEISWRLDLAQSGRVAEVHVKDGSVVTAGQPLLRLSNPEFELDLGVRQSNLIRDLAGLKTQDQGLAQELETRRGAWEDLQFAAEEAAREANLKRRLHDKGILSDAEMQTLTARAEHAKARADRAKAAVERDERRIDAQRAALREAADLLDEQLAQLRESANVLLIVAPGAGRLTGFDPQIGARLTEGASLGRIDAEGRYKLTASVEEFHLSRVRIGRSASASSPTGALALTVTQIRPQVTNGRFQIDLAFAQGPPADLKPGQSFDGRLVLDEPGDALLLPVGAFLQETGGSWAFVLSADGASASRRDLTLGRRNPLMLEVLGGVRVGERVVISGYDDFSTATRLVFTGKGPRND